MKSKYHQYVGNILKTSKIFKFHKIYEEYPVCDINENWYSKKHAFDWVIESLMTIIEVHGQQHYTSVRWCKDISQEEADGKLEYQQYTDYRKEAAAKEKGWIYIAISYDDIDQGKITDEWLYNKIRNQIG